MKVNVVVANYKEYKMDIKITEDRENKVKAIREQDIITVLENAVNYGSPWDTLYCASIEEILELRRQVLQLGGSLPMKTCPINGTIEYPKLKAVVRC